MVQNTSFAPKWQNILLGKCRIATKMASDKVLNGG